MVNDTTLQSRPVCPEDSTFLFELYASTRAKELENWSSAQRDTFLRMQFLLQQQSYQAAFPIADDRIILSSNCRIGNLLSLRTPKEICLIYIALLPAYQNRGIGTYWLQTLQSEAERTHKFVRLQVLKVNPAMSLYQRLGFSIVEDMGGHWLMEWSPNFALVAGVSATE
jgi:GNAT superfamily N-acetyltransferase